MHLRVVKVRRHDTERRYVQLVESFRRPDGVPAHKLLASLGDLPELTLGNLKVALAASRQGRALVLPDAPPTSTGPMTVRANLRYLDLAVALHVWRASRLGDLLGSLLPQGQETLGPADVLTALVLQRCVAPRSKRYAQHWLPTTALPELLGIAPERFTNTRIHRLLDALDHVTDTLQARLPEVLLAEQKPGFGALFLDVTDVHFEGRGPQLAAYTRTKDGHPRRRCVGVVLLCDEGGRPLRWHVVAATRHDGDVMGAMVDELAACPWVQQAPVVCDRAMGQSKALARLHARKVRFLTAVPVSEIESTTDAIPLGPFRALALGGTDETRERDHALAVQAAERAGFLPVDASTYVLDLGVRSRLRPLPEFDPCDEAALPVEEEDDDEEQEAAWPRAVAAEAAPRPEPSGLRGAAAVLAEAKALRAQLASGAYRSAAALARAVGISQARLSQTFALLRLTADLGLGIPTGSRPGAGARRAVPLGSARGAGPGAPSAAAKKSRRTPKKPNPNGAPPRSPSRGVRLAHATVLVEGGRAYARGRRSCTAGGGRACATGARRVVSSNAATDAGAVTTAIGRRRPKQRGHSSASRTKVRASSVAQSKREAFVSRGGRGDEGGEGGRGAGDEGGVSSDARKAEGGRGNNDRCGGRRPRAGRSGAATGAGTTSERQAWWGANTP